MTYAENAEKLLQLVEGATSAFHTVAEAAGQLQEAGFEELLLKQEWRLNNGGRYYMVHHGSSMIAFTIGKKYNFFDAFRIAAAHTDFPCLRIKPKAEVISEKYRQLNVEIYGGAILNTWLDRPLSVAGRVVLRSEEIFHPIVRLITIKKPILIIPNLAIHQNKEVNRGVELNKQKDMLPITGMSGDKLENEEFFIKFLAQKLRVHPEDILDYELSLYNADAGDIVGMDEEFISAPRLDNLTSVQAVISGLIDGNRAKGINVAALFDHEEIGSRSKQGAGSSLLSMVLEKIMLSYGRSRMNFMEVLEDSLLLSVDVGHAVHPNRAEKSDPTNKIVLNGGFCIKESCSQSYATDSEAIGIVQQICEQEGISCQKFINRSDGTSGSTLGSIASALLPVRTVDMGVPLLAMHSSRELMGIKDQTSLVDCLTSYFAL